jgi:general secretion pathway protein D
VLGGLIQDSVTNSEQSVPLLGSIPIIGEFFRTRNTEKTKTNFLIFLQPHILRNDAQAAVETDAKYDYVRDQQRILNKDSRLIPLQPFQPADPLPAMENGRTNGGALSPDETDADRQHELKKANSGASSSGDAPAVPAQATPFTGASASPDTPAPPGGPGAPP